MATYSSEEAKKKYDSLPNEVKNLLYSPEMSFVVQQVGQKNKLHIDQIDILNTETGQVMLGFTDPADFPAVLVEMLKVNQTQADAIAKDVNDMLFSKIRESMKASSPQASVTSSPSAIPAPSVPTPAPTAPPSKPTETHPADLMLNQKTVSVPVSSSTPPPQAKQPVVPEPPNPSQYKTDPYREPPQ